MSSGTDPRAQSLRVGGPFFDDLFVGLTVESASGCTLTHGHAALHQAILGDRLRLALDATLSQDVLGEPALLAHPALVWDLAIGQSTLLTQRVKANLFYRGLAFRRTPVIGDTLRTRTEVVALRHNSVKPGRAPTGMAVLRIQTVDQLDRPVLDFLRCAMLPVSESGAQSGCDDDLDAFQSDVTAEIACAPTARWKLANFRSGGPSQLEGVREGQTLAVGNGDVVSSAPELARLTLNIAAAHHDDRISGRRLVYGGHTIGIAAAQLVRALPDLVTIVAWHSCDHLAPVYENDTLYSETVIERLDRLPSAGGLLHLRTRVWAMRENDESGGRIEVLDWRYVGVIA
jgi:acyl dehydratase